MFAAAKHRANKIQEAPSSHCTSRMNRSALLTAKRIGNTRTDEKVDTRPNSQHTYMRFITHFKVNICY